MAEQGQHRLPGATGLHQRSATTPLAAQGRARKAFTLIEAMVAAFVVVAMITFMVVPGVHRARDPHRKARGKANLARIGAALDTWREDHDGAWPEFCMPESENGNVNAWGRLLAGGYVDDRDVFASPTQPDWLELKPAWSGLGSKDGTVPSVLNAGYAYDNARIPRNADPGRIVAGDNLETSWRPDALDKVKRTGSWQVGPNHANGAHVLAADGAVQWISAEAASKYWVPYQGLTPGSQDAKAWGPDWSRYPVLPGAADYDFVRQGIIMNRRIDEDDHANWSAEDYDWISLVDAISYPPDMNNYQPAIDVDDAYGIEADTTMGTLKDQWELLAEWQARTGYYELGASGEALSEDHVPLSKTDCSLVPPMGFRAGFGWPDSLRPVGSQRPQTFPGDWRVVPRERLQYRKRVAMSPRIWTSMTVAAVAAALVLLLGLLLRRLDLLSRQDIPGRTDES